MRIPSDETRRLMEVAAELRAAGATWETIAENLNRNVGVVKRWPAWYRDDWERLLKYAEEQQSRLANNESRSALRRLLRSKNSRVRLTAADKLTALRLKEAAASTKAPQDDLSAFLAHLEQITDEQLERYIAQFIETMRRREDAA